MKIKTSRHTIDAVDDISTQEIVRVELSTDDDAVTVHIDLNPATVLMNLLSLVARSVEMNGTRNDFKASSRR